MMGYSMSTANHIRKRKLQRKQDSVTSEEASEADAEWVRERQKERNK